MKLQDDSLVKSGLLRSVAHSDPLTSPPEFQSGIRPAPAGDLQFPYRGMGKIKESAASWNERTGA